MAPVDPKELGIEKRWLVWTRHDSRKFRLFYEKYRDDIYGFVYRRTLDPDLAKELSNEVFLRAQRNLWKFRWQGVTMGAYLFRIALNVVRAHEESEGRFIDSGEKVYRRVEQAPGPLVEAMVSDAQRKVRDAVRDLDATSREIFQLHYWEDMTTREIAVVLEIPEGTVKTRLQRGRDGMRAALKTFDEGIPDPKNLSWDGGYDSRF